MWGCKDGSKCRGAPPSVGGATHTFSEGLRRRPTHLGVGLTHLGGGEPMQEPCQYGTTYLLPQSAAPRYAAFARGKPSLESRLGEGLTRHLASSVSALHPRFFQDFLFTGVTDSTRHQFLLFSDMSTHVYVLTTP